jgi:hypothetical protein
VVAVLTVIADPGTDKSAPVRTRADLAAILPSDVVTRLTPDVWHDLSFIAPLRILAAIDDPRWHDAVTPIHIDWASIYAWSRVRGELHTVRLAVEIAASMYGDSNARPDMCGLLRRLDVEHGVAVLDALRIADEGLAS